MRKEEKSPFNKHHNCFFRQESLMDTKTGRQKYNEKYWLEASPLYKILTNDKEENSDTTMEKPGKPSLTRES